MNKSKHTPGPWAVTKGGAVASLQGMHKSMGRGCGKALGTYVAVFEKPGPSRMQFLRPATEEEAEANARLIAAAPEMLELLEWIARDDGETLAGLKARKLLRRIRGEG